MGLTVALDNSEAIWFASPSKRGPRQAHLNIEEVCVEIGSNMKYLDLVLDSRWSFYLHMQKLAPRLDKTILGLSRLMPNVGEPEVVHVVSIWGWCNP